MQLPHNVLIFDVDGTLLQTEQIALPAFRKVFETLQQHGMYSAEYPTDEKIMSCFGMTIPEVWETLLPDASMDVRDRANDWLAEQEIALMESGTGALYPGVRETLQQLHDQGARLYTASNGEKRYVETVIDTYGLAPLFTKLYTAGEYKTEKKEQLVARLLQDTGTPPEQAVMIGDRRSDVTAGNANGLVTIGCDFGFAGRDELDEADEVIDQFDQLLTLLPEIRKVK